MEKIKIREFNSSSGRKLTGEGELKISSQLEAIISPRSGKNNFRISQWSVKDPYVKKEASQVVAFKKGLTKNKLSEKELPRKLSPKELQNQRSRYKELVGKIVSVDVGLRQTDFHLDVPLKQHNNSSRLSSPSPGKSPNRSASLSPLRTPTASLNKETFEVLKTRPSDTPIRPFTNSYSPIKVKNAPSESQIITIEPFKSNDTNNEDHKPKIVHAHTYVKADSKFSEIVDLQKRIAELEKENEDLRNQLRTIDEFKLAMDRKRKVEHFHEKRIDLLKGQLSRQKRYIDHIHKALKQTKLFHKDLKAVLEYLIELDRKYMKSKFNPVENEQKDEDTKHKGKGEFASSPNDNLYKVLFDMFREKNKIDELEKFVLNFNEAYEKIKRVQQTNEEVAGMFSISMNLMKSENMVENRINPEVQKKIKYNYLLKKFIDRNKRLFPVFSVWNEYDKKDKENFTIFLQSLEKISNKITDVFRKVSAFDLMKHNNFHYNEETPDILIENAVEFQHYFNSSSKGKRIWLNSTEILEVEKSLSLLLSKLIWLQRLIFVDKGKISVQLIFEIEELLRTNIEKLLCLGIATDVDATKGGKIILVNKLYEQGYRPVRIFSDEKQPSLKEKMEKFYLEVYSWEEENLKKFEYGKSGVDLYLQKLLKPLNEWKQANPGKATQLDEEIERFKLHLDHIGERYKEVHAVSRFKDLQLKYYKEYANVVTSDFVGLESFVKSKAASIDGFFKRIHEGMRELAETFDQLFEHGDYNNPKYRRNFSTTFKRFYSETTDMINKVFASNSHSGTIFSEIKTLEDSFRPQFEKLQTNLNYYSERLSNITLKVQ